MVVKRTPLEAFQQIAAQEADPGAWQLKIRHVSHVLGLWLKNVPGLLVPRSLAAALSF